jgi:hypothetical protein
VIKRQGLAILIIVLLVIPLFHNCGKMQVSSDSQLSSACATDMLPVFEKTYHKFFTTHTCNGCHKVGGQAGFRPFADDDLAKALNAFMVVSPDGVENKIKAGHQGFSYTSFETDLVADKKEWSAAEQKSSCSGSDVVTSGRNILFFEPHPVYSNVNIVKSDMQGWQTITWDLDKGQNPVTAGVQLSIDVSVSFDPTLLVAQNYLVSNLKIKSTKHDLHIQGVYILLNKKTYFVTTFKKIDAQITKGPDFQALAEGSAAGIFVKDVGEKYENGDSWSVQIENLE